MIDHVRSSIGSYLVVDAWKKTVFIARMEPGSDTMPLTVVRVMILLVGGLELFFPIQLGMPSSQLTNSNLFQRGLFSHQPVLLGAQTKHFFPNVSASLKLPGMETPSPR